MRQLITRLQQAESLSIIINSGSLVATTGATAILGFAYWWLAVRYVVPAEVGFAAAAIAAMTMLGTFSMLGLGTMLMGELPRRRVQRSALILAALGAGAGVALLLGIGFALVAPFLARDLAQLAADLTTLVVFAFGVALTTVALVLDQALIGLLQGGLQFARNVIFGVAKLALLWLGVAWLGQSSGMAIYLTWLLGNLIALLALGGYVAMRYGWRVFAGADWSQLRSLGGASLKHHLLNMVVIAPGMVLPLIVTAMLSATANAYFYTAWMLAGFVSVGPVSLATVLYAVGSGNPRLLAQRLRFTMAAGAVIGLVANLALLVAGPRLLSVYGPDYVAGSLGVLRLLALGVFPLIIREHYVALARIRGQTLQATKLLVVVSMARIAGAVVGLGLADLIGLVLGLLLVESLAALVMLPLVARTAMGQIAATPESADQAGPERLGGAKL